MRGWRDAPVDYPRRRWQWTQHAERFKRHVESRVPKLICQDCGGMGGETQVLLDDGTGPWDECGWCEGNGYTTAWLRGYWLRCKREERAA